MSEETLEVVNVLMVASNERSPFGPSWIDVMKHIGQRLKWSYPGFSPNVVSASDPISKSEHRPELVVFVGIAKGDIDAAFFERFLQESRPEVVLSFESAADELQHWISLGGMNPVVPNVLQQIQSRIPGSVAKKVQDVYAAITSIWSRQSSDDIVYLLQLATDQFITPLPEMADLNPDFQAIKCIGRNCREEVIRCLLDPQCRKALDCINSCGINDQVCSYRCIVSYESELLEKFSLCILQKHNCLGNTASIPQLPDVHPMRCFRGEPLTFDTAEEIFIGSLGTEAWSWKVVLGKNPAYDYFPCQFQLFYQGKARESMWYDPVFKVITLDGQAVWRRRHYRVRRAKDPGAFYFSVLDNGVTSNEFWRIVDADDELNWALFYYSGAAAAAGISYTGAVLGTLDGQLPADSEMKRVEEALERCGIKMWETSRVDYSSCDNPPLEIPSQWRK